MNLRLKFIFLLLICFLLIVIPSILIANGKVLSDFKERTSNNLKTNVISIENFIEKSVSNKLDSLPINLKNNFISYLVNNYNKIDSKFINNLNEIYPKSNLQMYYLLDNNANILFTNAEESFFKELLISKDLFKNVASRGKTYPNSTLKHNTKLLHINYGGSKFILPISISKYKDYYFMGILNNSISYEISSFIEDNFVPKYLNLTVKVSNSVKIINQKGESKNYIQKGYDIYNPKNTSLTINTEKQKQDKIHLIKQGRTQYMAFYKDISKIGIRVVATQEYNPSIFSSDYIVLVFYLLIGTIIMLIILYIGLKKIFLKPINNFVKYNKEICRGDLSSELPVLNNEYQEFSITYKEMIEELRDVIKHISESSTQYFNTVVESRLVFEGNFLRLNSEKEVIQEFSDDFDNFIKKITDLENISENSMKYSKESMEKANQNISVISTLFEDIKLLTSKFEKIEEFSNEIRSIATQTNLLSLNASIESSKAGDSGRGFSVVASEIRKLAGSTKEFAENISNLTSETGNVLGKVSKSTKKVEEVLKFIVGNLQGLNALINKLTNEIQTVEDKSISLSDDLSNAHDSLGSSIDTLSTTQEHSNFMYKEFNHLVEKLSFFRYLKIPKEIEAKYRSNLFDVIEYIEDNIIIDPFNFIVPEEQIKIGQFDVPQVIINNINLCKDTDFLNKVVNHFPGYEVSILVYDQEDNLVRVNTTAKNAMGNSLKGTTVDTNPKYFEKVLSGLEHSGVQTLFNKIYYTNYIPYTDDENNIVYIISTGTEIKQSEIDEFYENLEKGLLELEDNSVEKEINQRLEAKKEQRKKEEDLL